METRDKQAGIIVIPAVRLSIGNPQDRTVEQMADRYLRELAEVEWTDALVLIGFSMDGLVTLEKAHRIATAGSPPPTVVLIETEIPRGAPDESVDWIEPLEVALRIRLDRQALAGLSLPAKLELVRDAAVGRGDFPDEVRTNRLRRLAEVSAANHRAGQSYRPLRCAGPVHLLRVVREPTSPDTSGWPQILPDVVVHDVPVDHHAMLEENALSVIANGLARQ